MCYIAAKAEADSGRIGAWFAGTTGDCYNYPHHNSNSVTKTDVGRVCVVVVLRVMLVVIVYAGQMKRKIPSLERIFLYVAQLCYFVEIVP